MALVSPGVQVSVVDESFYTPAEPGTLPMIFVASASNKANGAGTGTAPGTTAATAGTPYLLTSQRDLVDTFGDPLFKTDTNNNPIHGSELNEYGLQAAYSYLGIANRAYVVRADIDLGQLEASVTAPAANPQDGTYWFDTKNTLWGIQQWNGDSVIDKGQVFSNKVPIVITDETQTSNTGSLGVNGYSGYIPADTVGAVGDYAVIATTTLNRIFYRNTSGNWVLVGSDPWAKSWPTIKGTASNPSLSTANITINGTSVAVDAADTVSDVADTINGLSITGVTAAAVDSKLEIYSDGTGSASNDSTLGGDILIGGDSTLLGQIGITAGTYYPPALTIAKHTNIPEYKISDTYTRPTGSVWIKTTTPNLGAKYVVKKWNNTTQLWESSSPSIYGSNNEAIFNMDKSGGGANLLAGDLYVLSNVAGDTKPLATFKIYRRTGIAPTTITSSKIIAGSISAGTSTFTVASTDNSQLAFNTAITVSGTYTGAVADATVLAGAINNANIENVSATVNAQNKVTITHALGGEIKFVDDLGSSFISVLSPAPNFIS